MSTQLIFIVIGIVIIFGALNVGVMFFLLRRKQEAPAQDDTGLKLILQQVNELSRTVDNKIGESNKQMNETVRHQFNDSQKLITEINEQVTKHLLNVVQGITKLDETSKQVIGFTDQLQSLQDILKNPKQRGILGEYYLETLLKNILPPGMYEMQHDLGIDEATGQKLICDAVVFIKDKIVPVDSKFSLENYNRLVEEKNAVEKDKLEKLFVNDLKNRIVETAKYIQPSRNTMDFAFMFIPHEAIYYDLLTNRIGVLKEESENLIQRAASKYKVIIVSPTSFLAYLQTVMQGLKALQIEETAKDIVKRVDELGKHLKTYEDYHIKLGNALGTTVNHYNASGKELKKVDKDVMRITGSAPGIELLSIDKPDREDE